MKRSVVQIRVRASNFLDAGLETQVSFLILTKLLHGHGEPRQTKKCARISFLNSAWAL